MVDVLIGLALGGVALAAGVFVGNKLGQKQKQKLDSPETDGGGSE